MSWWAAVPAALGVVSGLGALESNEDNKATKAEIENQQKQALALADPIGNTLTQGYQPGGWLRDSAISEARIPGQRRQGETLGALRSNAWRYGGSGSGVPRRRWQDAKVAGEIADAEGLAAGDAASLDILSRMDTMNMGYANAFNPWTYATNPLEWVGPAYQSFSTGAGGSL